MKLTRYILRNHNVLYSVLLYCFAGFVTKILFDFIEFSSSRTENNVNRGGNQHMFSIFSRNKQHVLPTSSRYKPDVLPASRGEGNSYTYNVSQTSNTDDGDNLIMSREFRKHSNISCRKIIENDKIEIMRAKQYMQTAPLIRYNDEYFIAKSKDCARFRRDMRYDIYPVTDEERNFPIAFSILTFRNADQTERLLHAIYRPHNFYCIHVDLSAPVVLHKALEGISNCFGNVFIVSKTEDIIYSHITRLRADLNCMLDLLAFSKKWKYFINLPHENFPLKTNLEMVKILKIYNGANDIEGMRRRTLPARYRDIHIYNKTIRRWKNLGPRNTSLPGNTTIVKGSAYGIFSREFVQFIFNDKQAIDILKLMETVQSPDEYYWATLNHNEQLNAPGQYTGQPEKKPWLAVYAAWADRDPCKGKFIRSVCVFGIGDLNDLVLRKELFANKFYQDYEYLTLDCLEQYLYNRTFSNMTMDMSYYNNLPFIKRNK